MWIVGTLLGAVIGLAFGHAYWLVFALMGGMAGFLIDGKSGGKDKRIEELSERINVLSGDVYRLKHRLRVLEEQGGVTPTPRHFEPRPVIQEMVSPVEGKVSAVADSPVSEQIAESPEAPNIEQAEQAPVQRQDRQQSGSEESGPSLPVLQWLLGGNTVARVGIIILFFGLAFLLKYAYEHSHIPIHVRLIGVSVGALALLVTGWRLREQRAGYALSLQGGGLGVLYLDIFAAFRFYDLIPAAPAFLLLFAIAALSAMLAVLQNSLALAIFGFSGGFLAPLLISTGQGDHELLFFYCLMLNLGILVISWYKPWRMLNLLGLGFTFAIGCGWGLKYYSQDMFASVECFLVAFYLLYVAIPILFAMRQAENARHYVDATLVFGVPLLGFGMQTFMVRGIEYASAWSALGLAAFYIALASVLWRRAGEYLRLLSEAFLALGVVFATLTVPLAFDGRVTSAIWALEGAAIFWIGVRQNRLPARCFGYALQIVAGIAFLSGNGVYGTVPVFNSLFMGCAFLATGGLFCSACLARKQEVVRPWEGAIANILLGWGVLWWATAGLVEIEHHCPLEFRRNASLLFLVISSATYSLLSETLSWPNARWPAYALLPVAVVFAFQETFAHVQPGAGFGYLVWPLTFLLHFRVLRRHQGDELLQYWLHAAGLWLLTFVVSREFDWQIDTVVAGEHVWPLIAWAVAPCAFLILITSERARLIWPLAAHENSYLVAGALPLVLFLGGWTLFGNFTSDGDPAPLPYLPLLNPLDLAECLAFLAVAFWMTMLRRSGHGNLLDESPTIMFVPFGSLLFVFANGVLLRTLHHWAGVPYVFEAMYRSMLVQASISLFWSVLALVAMFIASRRDNRPLWIVGACLMVIVVGKLFLVDLSNVGGMERIVSFIGVGILMLIIGYLSPVPPSRTMQETVDAN